MHNDLKAEEVNVTSAVKKGQVILRFCHPSAVQIVQQWLARLKKRWEDVWKWSIQRLTRLEEEHTKLVEEEHLMAELMKWIAIKEEVLLEKEKEAIPEEDYEEVKRLLEEHKVSYKVAMEFLTLSFFCCMRTIFSGMKWKRSLNNYLLGMPRVLFSSFLSFTNSFLRYKGLPRRHVQETAHLRQTHEIFQTTKRSHTYTHEHT